MSVPVTKTIGGETYTLHKLTPSDIHMLASIEFDRERTQLLKDLDDAKATSAERLEKLREHSGTRDLGPSVARMAFRTQGAMDIVRTAGSKPGSTNIAIETVPISPDELIELALELVGENIEDMRTRARASGPGTGADETNPTTAGSDQQETGIPRQA